MVSHAKPPIMVGRRELLARTRRPWPPFRPTLPSRGAGDRTVHVKLTTLARESRSCEMHRSAAIDACRRLPARDRQGWPARRRTEVRDRVRIGGDDLARRELELEAGVADHLVVVVRRRAGGRQVALREDR